MKLLLVLAVPSKWPAASRRQLGHNNRKLLKFNSNLCANHEQLKIALAFRYVASPYIRYSVGELVSRHLDICNSQNSRLENSKSPPGGNCRHLAPQPTDPPTGQLPPERLIIVFFFSLLLLFLLYPFRSNCFQQIGAKACLNFPSPCCVK